MFMIKCNILLSSPIRNLSEVLTFVLFEDLSVDSVNALLNIVPSEELEALCKRLRPLLG